MAHQQGSSKVKKWPTTQLMTVQKSLILLQNSSSQVITSDHGHTQGDNTTILLTGNVIITNENNPAFKMLTDELTLDTQYNTAYTDHAVTIKTPNGDTDSVGLHADMNDETINLHSRVKGQYDAPAN